MTDGRGRMTLDIGQLVDPFEARIVIDRDASGAVAAARFDLSGLPRLDPVLAGRDVAGVPDTVKMLCGLCPVAHHLAGVRALESAAPVGGEGSGAGGAVPAGADAVRRLLHHGSMIDQIAPRLLGLDRDAAVAFKSLGKTAMAAAGCPGHFPDVAVPGGVRGPADRGLVDELADTAPAAADRAMALATRAGDADGDWADRWDGWNIILAGADGRPDPLGSHVLAVRGGERVLLAVADFDARVDESRPGAAAPRPVLDLPGHGTVGYRVGPVAASRAAGRIDGPVAAQARVLAESVAAVVDIVTDRRDDLLAAGAADPASGWKAGVPVRGVGAVDGPRGLLVHRYDGDGAGRLASCRILTPTAQNEPWLAAMLAEAVGSGGSGAGIVGARASGAGADEPGTGVDESRNVGSGSSPGGQAASRAHPAMEAAVRAADPCLPISSAPAGSMRLSVVDEPPASAPAGRSGSGTG
ncbi:reducing hydrogenase subunit alpha [Corynebacterium sp.]|uniref:reducing hydrogenase subunit alpha n=1 Tax=Corynebacterium sp. TaxID=1720 RepID=UPI0026DDC62F|nr:reducing hydrogenase subunit alpha [Corynebacterium sp.]MDO4609810.1 reducing hydrogenase subunit alpha [Corynebacterium sp.]